MTDLSKLVMMLSSTNDHEVLAAARAIGKQLSAQGRDWHWLAAKLTMHVPHVPYKGPVHEYRGKGPPEHLKPTDLQTAIGIIAKMDQSSWMKRDKSMFAVINSKVAQFGDNAYLSFEQKQFILEKIKEVKDEMRR